MAQDLRSVEVTIDHDYSPWLAKGLYVGTYRGLFHGFFATGSESEGIECTATVELESGHVITVGAEHIKFLDRDTEPKVPSNYDGPF